VFSASAMLQALTSVLTSCGVTIVPSQRRDYFLSARDNADTDVGAVAAASSVASPGTGEVPVFKPLTVLLPLVHRLHYRCSRYPPPLFPAVSAVFTAPTPKASAKAKSAGVLPSFEKSVCVRALRLHACPCVPVGHCSSTLYAFPIMVALLFVGLRCGLLVGLRCGLRRFQGGRLSDLCLLLPRRPPRTPLGQLSRSVPTPCAL
jgi:hypothetical protein